MADTSSSTSSSSPPLSSTRREDIDSTVRNQLNKLIEMFIDTIRVLRKEWKNISPDLTHKFDKMIAVCYMDKFDAKKTIYAIYDKFLAEYKYDQLALYHTINTTDDMISEIEELLSEEEEEENEDSREDSRSDRDEDRGRRKDNRSDHRKERK